MSLRVGAPAVAGALLLGCLPSPAAAGTAAIETATGPLGPIQELTYEADPGESNDVTVSVEADFVRVEDPAGVTAGSGCRLEAGSGDTVATCPVVYPAPARLSLGDRDDRARVISSDLHDVAISGGAGDDELSSTGPYYNFLTGGPGDDVMTGGGEGTLFDEGPRRNGSDTMSAQAPPQSATPSWSNAWVDYAARRRPIHADLRTERGAGEAGEGDRLETGITAVWGGSASDRLVGDREDNSFVGGAGADVLVGRGGDDMLWATRFRRTPDPYFRERVIRGRAGDRLFGGPGEDFLEGSAGGNLLVAGLGGDQVIAAAGPDRIRGRDGYADEIQCEGGRDVVREDAVDFARGCERSSFRSEAAVPIRVDGDAPLCGRPHDPPCQSYAVVDVGCRGKAAGRCGASVRLELDGAVVAADSFSYRDSSEETGGPGYVELEIPVTEEVFGLLEKRDARLSVVVVSRHRAASREVSVRVPRLGDGFGIVPFPVPSG